MSLKSVMCIAASALILANTTTATAQSDPDPATYNGPDRTERLVAAAKKEGSLMYYTTTPPAYVKLLADGFEKKYGIKVNIWRGLSEQVLQRTIAETRGGKHAVDVIQSQSVAMEALYREGMLLPVKTPLTKNLIQDALPSNNGWVPSMHYVFVMAYNTNKVKKEELPKTYDDLLDPKWKGRLAIESSDYDWFYALSKDMGEQKARTLFCALGSKNEMSVRHGHALLTTLVSSGEVPMGLTLYQYSPAQAKAQGAPIDWHAIEPAIATTDGIGVAKKAPHPNAAILFFDYMLSDEGQAIIAKIGYVPTSKNIESPMKGTRIKRLKAAAMLAESEKSQVLFEDIFVNKRACK
jgi:iron(III) transport system substrate-binding protein